MSYKYSPEMETRMKEVLSVKPTREGIAQLVAEFSTEGSPYPEKSVAAKARALSLAVQSAEKSPVFTAEEGAALTALLQGNHQVFTSAEVAEKFAGGKFSPKQISGKALALKRVDALRKTEKKVVAKKYSPEEEARITELQAGGASLEKIAAELGKEVTQMRGKLLSMKLTAPQENKKAPKTGAYEGLEILAPTMTVEELVAHYDKTPRGVKTMLTRKGLVAKDYDGTKGKE